MINCSTVLPQYKLTKILDKFRNLGMDLKVEDDVAGFIGVLIMKLENNKIERINTG
jgi:hypothetical protein